jgi:dipeptidyl aminopeptidase/acylaminoacyl peptidase
LGIFLAMCLVLAVSASAERALWLRYPAISPDGKAVVFSYHGNLWKVAATGGRAEPLTLSDAFNTMPVWSPDGTRIAFASDRYGNFDIFVMPAEGGEAKRLTFHSADETPTSFTPDGKAVLFTAAILDAASNVLFPTPAQPELYEVGLGGGMTSSDKDHYDGWMHSGSGSLGFWYSEKPWGPWKQFHYADHWVADDPRSRIYQPKLSPKWMSPDGREMVLIWSDAMPDTKGQTRNVHYTWNMMKISVEI